MEITFNRVKEMLEFALSDDSLLVIFWELDSMIYLYDRNMDNYYTIRHLVKNDNHYIEIELYKRGTPCTSIGGTHLIPISNVESKEFEMLVAKIEERNNRICRNNFDLDFFK